ncbi:hypothetical protein, variant 1 [Cladophialophora immunda]|uniref:Uncharacterized protein n=1 Tax=Cladophialophora immunda TaxID=569365 RepID=A0A0D2BTV7_9EURO|nr:hypothetical protein, variant 1 [Cladophialophora immunda]KIW21860.1 hypothetical protein, variant 1 [Cladophialophora immunda]
MDQIATLWRLGPLKILCYLLGFLILYVLSVCFYRLTLHPLARIPGPFLSKLTDWSIVLQASSGSRHILTWKEHKEYGTIVRIGPNTLSFNTASALKAIYASRHVNLQKAPWYLTIDAGSGAASVHSEIDRDRHAFRRRVLDQAVSDLAEQPILDKIKTWVGYLGSESKANEQDWSEPTDMKDWCNWLSFDIMGELTFGQSFGCVDKGEYRFVSDVVLNATKFVYVAGFWPFISLVRPLLGTKWASLLFAKKAHEYEAYIRYANSMMERRIGAEKNPTQTLDGTPTTRRKDFVHHLLHARDPQTDKGLTLSELHADSALLIHAGSDTTALTLSAAIFYLVHHPLVLATLQGLVRTTFPTLDSIRAGSELLSLPYLRACIDETMRLAPPVPSHLPREVLAGGIEIDGSFFPEGTIVGVAPWSIHHNAVYFPDPFKYNPDRWMAASDADTDNGEDGRKAGTVLARSAFCPFGVGSRGCAGKRLAYLEVSLALATFLWVYDVRLYSSTASNTTRRSGPGEGKSAKKHADVRDRTDLYQLWDHFVADREGPVVQLKRANVSLGETE